jgi:hypothetical protein
LEVVRVLCVNLNVRWSWTLNWKQIWEVNKHDLDKLERNKDIRHTHSKEIYVIEIFVINVLWKRIISCLWVHAGGRLDVLWKGILHFYGYWKIILFLWLLVTLILVDYETGWIGKIISYLSIHKKYSNRRSYISCALIYKQGDPEHWVGNKYGK